MGSGSAGQVAKVRAGWLAGWLSDGQVRLAEVMCGGQLLRLWALFASLLGKLSDPSTGVIRTDGCLISSQPRKVKVA